MYVHFLWFMLFPSVCCFLSSSTDATALLCFVLPSAIAKRPNSDPLPTYTSKQFSNVNDTASFYQKVQDIILTSAP